MAKYLLTCSYCRVLIDGKTRHAMRLVNVTELDSMQQRRAGELGMEVEQ